MSVGKRREAADNSLKGTGGRRKGTRSGRCLPPVPLYNVEKKFCFEFCCVNFETSSKTNLEAKKYPFLETLFQVRNAWRHYA